MEENGSDPVAVPGTVALGPTEQNTRLPPPGEGGGNAPSGTGRGQERRRGGRQGRRPLPAARSSVVVPGVDVNAGDADVAEHLGVAAVVLEGEAEVEASGAEVGHG